MKVGEKLYQYRYIIGVLVVTLGVIMNVNGSSIAMWGNYVTIEDTDTWLGIPRPIRGDEWATLTPMTISQGEGTNPYSYISEIIRATDTDTFMVYSLPVKTIWSIFHPFLLGYIILGSARGLAFFWWARAVCLWLISFDLLCIITKGRRLISITGATMILWSPVVQWWFAVNGFCEILIFGALLVIMLYKYLNQSSFWKRCIILAVMVFAAGSYAMVLYPAWQVPFFYIFAALGIYICVSHYKKGSIRWYDTISIITASLVLASCLIMIVYRSADTIELVMNTAYPGKRSETGGGAADSLYLYVANVFFPYFGGAVPGNVCESAHFISFFPIGELLTVSILWKKRGRDVLRWILLIVDFLIIVWCVNGFPEVLAKYSLFYLSTVNRAVIGQSYISMLLLLLSIAQIQEWLCSDDKRERFHKIAGVVLAVFISLYIGYFGKQIYLEYLNRWKWMLMISVIFAVLLLIQNLGKKWNERILCIGLICISIVAGAFVNPVQHGLANIDRTELANEIHKIVQSDTTGKWIVLDDATMGAYPIMFGAPTINSPNVYPTLNRWKQLDESGTYEDIYNRYAHIRFCLSKEKTISEPFDLYAPDAFSVTVNNQGINTLGVSYIITKDNITDYSDEKTIFQDYGVYSGWHVFHVVTQG